ncbi:MAG TPA: hypothetical protein VJZ00_22445, partial [Thermoanaerobaculia bacterium]|nr:hypothetical protein [Thermoanaerobaculia bacterium]
ERGEMDAARAALTRAAGAIERCGDRELKRAIIWYADAAICASRDVWEPTQALALLARCEPIFAAREPARSRDAQTLRGIIHLHSGEYVAAMEDFAAVASRTDVANRVARADALRNLANAFVRVGRLDNAESLLREVRTADIDLGRKLHIIRNDALAAVLAQSRKDFKVASRRFEDVQRRFAAAGEHESAMIAGKERAVSLVAAGQLADAAAVLRQLLASGVAAGSDRKRFTAEAFAYLRDLAERNQLTFDIASAVAAYVDRIHVQRAVPFTPPMSSLTM